MIIAWWLCIWSLRLGNFLTVVLKFEVGFDVSSGLDMMFLWSFIDGVLVCVPMTDILSPHGPRRLHLLGSCEIVKRPLAVMLGLWSLITRFPGLRSILRVCTICKVEVGELLGVGTDGSVGVGLGFLRLSSMLTTIENAHRLKVLTLASLAGRHSLASSTWRVRLVTENFGEGALSRSIAAIGRYYCGQVVGLNLVSGTEKRQGGVRVAEGVVGAATVSGNCLVVACGGGCRSAGRLDATSEEGNLLLAVANGPVATGLSNGLDLLEQRTLIPLESNLEDFAGFVERHKVCLDRHCQK